MTEAERKEPDPERQHAQRVRLMSRVSWPIMVAGTMLALGPMHTPIEARAAVLALMFGLVAGLNVPAFGVVRRAIREDVPGHLVGVLGGTLLLRVGTALALAILLSLG